MISPKLKSKAQSFCLRSRSNSTSSKKVRPSPNKERSLNKTTSKAASRQKLSVKKKTKPPAPLPKKAKKKKRQTDNIARLNNAISKLLYERVSNAFYSLKKSKRSGVQMQLARLKETYISKWEQILSLVTAALCGKKEVDRVVIERIRDKMEENKMLLETRLVKELPRVPTEAQTLLQTRQQAILQRTEAELRRAEQKRTSGEASEQSFKYSVDRIEAWKKNELEQIQGSKQHIIFGLNKLRRTLLKTDKELRLRLTGKQIELGLKSYSSGNLINSARMVSLFLGDAQTITKEELKRLHHQSQPPKVIKVRSKGTLHNVQISQPKKNIIKSESDARPNQVKIKHGQKQQQIQLAKEKQIAAEHKFKTAQTNQTSADFLNGSKLREKQAECQLKWKKSSALLKQKGGELIHSVEQLVFQEVADLVARQGLIGSLQRAVLKFSTDIFAVEDQLQQIISLAAQNKHAVEGRLRTPLPPSPKTMLMYLRQYPPEVEQEQPNDPVLGLELLQQMEKRGSNGLKLIHRRAIFDAFNQALDQVRPFGQKGEPYPWKSRPSSAVTFEQGTSQAKQRTLDWSQCILGFIYNKYPFQDRVISQSQHNAILESRLSSSLATEAFEEESRWLFYDDEEAQCIMELESEVTAVIWQQEARHLRSLLVRKF